MTPHLRPVALVPALLLAGCATTTTYSRTYDAGPPPAALEGRVESIHEVVRRTQGDPGGGAIAGAVVGHGVGATVGGGATATGAELRQARRNAKPAPTPIKAAPRVRRE